MENNSFQPDFDLYRRAYLAAQEGASSFVIPADLDEFNQQLVRDAFREVNGGEVQLYSVAENSTVSDKSGTKFSFEVHIGSDKDEDKGETRPESRAKSTNFPLFPVALALGAAIFVSNTSHKEEPTAPPEPQAPVCNVQDVLPAGKLKKRISTHTYEVVKSTPVIAANGKNIIIREGVEVGSVEVCGDTAQVTVKGLVDDVRVWGRDVKLEVAASGIVHKGIVEGSYCTYKGRELPTIKKDECTSWH